uniref:Uncharacterized protein n=1 Tax=Anguilla anguilla TaxID=7936 RepID=A0A0E9U031_ANGAN
MSLNDHFHQALSLFVALFFLLCDCRFLFTRTEILLSIVFEVWLW